MANTSQQTIYTYISQLDPLQEALHDDDLFVVSHVTDELSSEYQSCNLKYSMLRDELYDYIQANMSSETDFAILDKVADLSSQFAQISGRIDVCLSACVALDNCRNNVIDKLSTINDKVAELDVRVSALEDQDVEDAR